MEADALATLILFVCIFYGIFLGLRAVFDKPDE